MSFDENKINVTDIAWAAGFYEGEGSTSYVRRRDGTRGHLRVSIPQQQKWPLDKLQQLFGGSITGPRKCNSCYQWELSSTAGPQFLNVIFTYLSPKRRQQVTIALDAYNWHYGRRRGHGVVSALPFLGWDAARGMRDFLRRAKLARELG